MVVIFSDNLPQMIIGLYDKELSDIRMSGGAIQHIAHRDPVPVKEVRVMRAATPSDLISQLERMGVTLDMVAKQTILTGAAPSQIWLPN